MYIRRDTIPVKVGRLTIGGSNEVIIQSMCTTKTADVEATVAEILRLEEAGCQIVRVTVNNKEAAEAIKEIKKRFIFRLSRISISITGWLCWLLRTGSTRFGSIQAISVAEKRLKRSSRRVRNREFRFGSA